MDLWREKAAAIAVREGDLLCAPVDDWFVAAKFLWVSQRHLNAMGIAVLARRFDTPMTALDDLPDYARLDMSDEEVTVLYPSVENVTKKNI